MADVTIRDIDDAVLRRLRDRAARDGRSVEEVAREILAASAPDAPASGREALLREIDGIRAMTPRPIPYDTSALVREGRDAR